MNEIRQSEPLTLSERNRNLSEHLKKSAKDIQNWPDWKKRIFGEAFPKANTDYKAV